MPNVRQKEELRCEHEPTNTHPRAFYQTHTSFNCDREKEKKWNTYKNAFARERMAKAKTNLVGGMELGNTPRSRTSVCSGAETTKEEEPCRELMRNFPIISWRPLRAVFASGLVEMWYGIWEGDEFVACGNNCDGEFREFIAKILKIFFFFLFFFVNAVLISLRRLVCNIEN